MLKIEEIQERLKMVNIQNFSKFAGVHQNSLYRMRDGKGDSSYSSVKKVSDAFILLGKTMDENNV
jgi:predicted transcriptional regulator